LELTSKEKLTLKKRRIQRVVGRRFTEEQWSRFFRKNDRYIEEISHEDGDINEDEGDFDVVIEQADEFFSDWDCAEQCGFEKARKEQEGSNGSNLSGKNRLRTGVVEQKDEAKITQLQIADYLSEAEIERAQAVSEAIAYGITSAPQREETITIKDEDGQMRTVSMRTIFTEQEEIRTFRAKNLSPVRFEDHLAQTGNQNLIENIAALRKRVNQELQEIVDASDKKGFTSLAKPESKAQLDRLQSLKSKAYQSYLNRYGETVLSNENAEAFLKRHADPDEVNEVITVKIGEKYRSAYYSPRSILDELYHIAIRLSGGYGWRVEEAAGFILTGSVPFLNPLIISHRDHTGNQRSVQRIVLAVEPWLSPETVQRAYAKVRAEVQRDNSGVARSCAQWGKDASSMFRFMLSRLKVGAPRRWSEWRNGLKWLDALKMWQSQYLSMKNQKDDEAAKNGSPDVFQKVCSRATDYFYYHEDLKWLNEEMENKAEMLNFQGNKLLRLSPASIQRYFQKHIPYPVKVSVEEATEKTTEEATSALRGDYIVRVMGLPKSITPEDKMPTFSLRWNRPIDEAILEREGTLHDVLEGIKRRGKQNDTAK
jgi:hypothetical protein